MVIITLFSIVSTSSSMIMSQFFIKVNTFWKCIRMIKVIILIRYNHTYLNPKVQFFLGNSRLTFQGMFIPYHSKIWDSWSRNIEIANVALLKGGSNLRSTCCLFYHFTRELHCPVGKLKRDTTYSILMDLYHTLDTNMKTHLAFIKYSIW